MSKRVVQEKEIASVRWEQKWDLLPALLRTLSSKGNTTTEENQLYKHLLMGEMELETALNVYLKGKSDNDLATVFHIMPPDTLKLALDHLKEAVSLAKGSSNSQSIQYCTALCLLGKVNFITGNYEGALRHYEELQLMEVDVDGFAKRDRLILAEAMALKGFAAEYIAAVQNSECAFDNVVSLYRSSCEMALATLADSQQWNSLRRNAELETTSVDIGLFLSCAFVRHCQVLLIIGNVTNAVNFCRHVLRAMECKSTMTTRKRIALELAHMLLSGTSSSVYAAPAVEMRSRSCSAGESSGERFNNSGHLSTSFNSGPRLSPRNEGLFCPKDELEESILLLLLNEAMVLDSTRSCNAYTLRRNLPSTQRTYNLMTLALKKRNQMTLLSESLEKGLRIGCEDFKLWFQFGVALSCAAKYHHALFVFNHCLELQGNNCTVLLQCAKLCINNLSKFHNALSYGLKAYEFADGPMEKANCVLACSIASSLLADHACSYENRLQLQQKAIDYARQAYDIDSNDDEICFQLALAEAVTQKLSSSLNSIRCCLSMNPYHLPCLHLLALVLSAQNKFAEALEVIDSTLMEFPDDFGLLQTKLKLTEECLGGKCAVAVGQQMLEIWSSIYDNEDVETSAVPVPAMSAGKAQSVARMTRTASDSMLIDATRSLKHMTLAADGNGQDGDDDDRSSSIPMSVRLERELSDAVSGTISSGSMPMETALALLAKIWQMLADVYLNMEDVTNASSCLQEASSVFPLSPDVLYLRGKLSEVQGNLTEAKACYESALSILPTHSAALQNLGVLYSELDNIVLAEKNLRNSLERDPSVPAVWHELGIVLDKTGEHVEASNCFHTSIELERNCPVVNFTCIPRLLRGGR